MENAHSTHGGFKGDFDAGAAKTTTVRGSYTRTESSGVRYGLSSMMGFDSETLFDFSVNNAVNPVNGNPRQNIRPRGTKSVSNKGHTFDLC